MMLQASSLALMFATLPLKAVANKLVWSKIREGVGGRVKVVISGGSSLPSFLEDFFEMAGIRSAAGPRGKGAVAVCAAPGLRDSTPPSAW